MDLDGYFLLPKQFEPYQLHLLAVLPEFLNQNKKDNLHQLFAPFPDLITGQMHVCVDQRRQRINYVHLGLAGTLGFPLASELCGPDSDIVPSVKEVKAHRVESTMHCSFPLPHVGARLEHRYDTCPDPTQYLRYVGHSLSCLTAPL